MNRPGVTRRELLAAGSVAAGSLALAGPGGLSRLGAGDALAARRGARFRRPLVLPAELTSADLTIPIRQAQVAALPGRKTPMWTYGGTFPGPTIRRPAGEPTRVTFANELPADAGELTVHLHGGHNSYENDGQPGGLTALQPEAFYCDLSRRAAAPGAPGTGNELLIGPGESRTYTFDGIEDGAPERAAFQWYHDHRLERTARNVWNGLAGMWILEDELEQSLPLPRGTRDLPLMIGDRSFDRRNRLLELFGDGGSNANPPGDSYVGKQVLVNGRAYPFHRVSGCRYRLRLLNTSNFATYNFHLTGGVEMVQIATDSGLMPRPIPRKRLLLSPGERAEVIVDFAPAAGQTVRLRSSSRRTTRKGAAQSEVGSLLEFRVGAKVPDGTSIPKTLRPLPGWVADIPPAPNHRWKIEIDGTFLPRWVINGRAFDPTFAETKVRLGETVHWEIHNASAAPHAFHLHHTDFLLLERDGRAPKPWERCLKDTFLIDPGERIRIAGHFSDHPGMFVVHCHMLDHEDHGLMSQFEVRA
jgi:spore coat protein A